MQSVIDDQPFYRPEWIAAHIRALTPKARVVLLTASFERRLMFVLPLLQQWSVFSILSKGRVPLRD
jgi:CelD/BcsL family acetyltransferase involved in cellulose biosynthesis